jgi:hypothetical protein
MLYIVLADLTIEELTDAHAVVPQDGTLSAMDADGKIVKEYERGDVLMFGVGENVKQLAERLRQQGP